MNTKVTLTIDQAIVEKAKKYAKQKHRSLSGLIESYLKAITDNSEEENLHESPIVQSLKGAFHAPQDSDYKEELQNALSEKYL